MYVEDEHEHLSPDILTVGLPFLCGVASLEAESGQTSSDVDANTQMHRRCAQPHSILLDPGLRPFDWRWMAPSYC
jgi:hypothetical protein